VYLNFKKILFIFLISSFALFVFKPIFADDLQNQIDQITKQISDLEAAITPLKNETVEVKLFR